MVNDNEDVHLLVQEALQEVQLGIRLNFLDNGEQLLEYLYRRGDYAKANKAPRPHLILLDINMPRLDGREALAIVKSDPSLAQIPIIILTTSYQPGDILQCYRLGANSFIAQPRTFNKLVEAMQSLCHFWFEIAALP
ncbi:MAG: response regulator [Actinomycetota bacterium]